MILITELRGLAYSMDHLWCSVSAFGGNAARNSAASDSRRYSRPSRQDRTCRRLADCEVAEGPGDGATCLPRRDTGAPMLFHRQPEELQNPSSVPHSVVVHISRRQGQSSASRQAGFPSGRKRTASFRRTGSDRSTQADKVWPSPPTPASVSKAIALRERGSTSRRTRPRQHSSDASR